MGGLEKFRANEAFHKNDIEIEKETFRNIVTSNIYQIMSYENINKTKLAELAGVSKAAITMTLSGDRNFTIDKLTEISSALGYTPLIEFKKKNLTSVFIRNYIYAEYKEEYMEQKELRVGPITINKTYRSMKNHTFASFTYQKKEYNQHE